MEKGSFYIRLIGGERTSDAQQVRGYATDDGIGLHRTGMHWTATHLATGLQLCAASTKKDALQRAREVLDGKLARDWLARVVATAGHADFLADADRLEAGDKEG